MLTALLSQGSSENRSCLSPVPPWCSTVAFPPVSCWGTLPSAHRSCCCFTAVSGSHGKLEGGCYPVGLCPAPGLWWCRWWPTATGPVLGFALAQSPGCGEQVAQEGSLLWPTVLLCGPQKAACTGKSWLSAAVNSSWCSTEATAYSTCCSLASPAGISACALTKCHSYLQLSLHLLSFPLTPVPLLGEASPCGNWKPLAVDLLGACLSSCLSVWSPVQK